MLNLIRLQGMRFSRIHVMNVLCMLQIIAWGVCLCFVSVRKVGKSIVNAYNPCTGYRSDGLPSLLPLRGMAMKEPRLPPMTLWGRRRGGFLNEPVYWCKNECILWDDGGRPFLTMGSEITTKISQYEGLVNVHWCTLSIELKTCTKTLFYNWTLCVCMWERQEGRVRDILINITWMNEYHLNNLDHTSSSPKPISTHLLLWQQSPQPLLESGKPWVIGPHLSPWQHNTNEHTSVTWTWIPSVKFIPEQNASSH